MRVYDLILKKRNGFALSKTEIEYLVTGYVEGSIPDYQMAAFLMAVYFQGMTEEETLMLTRSMISSGDLICLDQIAGIKVDKHSTGGVGDTTTLVLAPLVAAAGVPVAKLSGHGLGHTGGTLDKLESIPGFQTDLSVKELVEAVKKIGVAVAGQSASLVPADKKLYALRDITATVDSMPLIASSIMSKKLAAGTDALVFDVKVGSGAFIKDQDQAFVLARAMVNIGRSADRNVSALVTSMEQPLGRAVGNALEVEEAILTLRGEGPPDLQEICLVLGGWMLYLAEKVTDPEQGKADLKKIIESGTALVKFKELVKSQHGNEEVADNLSLLPRAKEQVGLKSPVEGYISRINTELIGSAAVSLGAGREKKEAKIDPAVGIMLEKKIGEYVRQGEQIAVIHTRTDTPPALIDSLGKSIISAYIFQKEPLKSPQLIYGWVDKKGEKYLV